MKRDTTNPDSTFTDSTSLRNILQVPYRQLLQEIKNCFKKDKQAFIEKAASLQQLMDKTISDKEANQELQPIHIAHILATEMHLPIHGVLAGFLYKSFGRHVVIRKKIITIFGIPLADLVEEIHTTSSIFTYQQGENFQDRLQAIYTKISNNTIILFIQIAENLAKMRFTCQLPKSEHLRIAAASSLIYVPIAQRLGLQQIKRELDTLALKYLQPLTYYMIEEKMKEMKKIGLEAIQQFEIRVDQLLKSIKMAYRLDKRIKTYASIWRKMQEKERRFEDLHDLFAARIVLQCHKREKEEQQICWQVYQLIKQYYRPVPGRLHDWISHPKKNGYQSLHTTLHLTDKIRIELQIRTQRMHQIAEYGSASHNEYKEIKEQVTYQKVFKAWELSCQAFPLKEVPSLS